MKKDWCGLLLTGLASGCAANAGVDEHFGPVAGESLMSLGGGLSVRRVDDADNTRTTDTEIHVGASHFFSDEHEFGMLASVERSEVESGLVDIDASLYGLSTFYNFNVKSGDRTWFYIGPHGGWTVYELGDADENSISYGGHVGFRHFHSTRTALFVEPRLTRYRLDGDDVDDISILVGLQYRF